MDATINPDCFLIATASLAHLGYSDVSSLIGLSNNLNIVDLDMTRRSQKIFTSVLTMSLKMVSR